MYDDLHENNLMHDIEMNKVHRNKRRNEQWRKQSINKQKKDTKCEILEGRECKNKDKRRRERPRSLGKTKRNRKRTRRKKKKKNKREKKRDDENRCL